ncbi:hypothetical protein [Mycobacterium neumannii]|uniref:hypothetical protein n=1 Tax=Mycobacterium neumannii TaxID=2048551 RepID=UPI003AB66296
MTMNDADVEALVGHVKQKLPPRFDLVPDGWPGNIELALIDAVLSIRAVYGVSASTGVRGAIASYKKSRSDRDSWDDLRTLAATDSAELQTVLSNRQKTGGVTKAEAIVSAARRLVDAGVIHAGDLDRDSSQHRAAYTGTKGLGPVTWAYFAMLLGHEGVKADTLVSRFVEQAIGRNPGANQVEELVTEAAHRLGISPIILDHAIWRYMSRPRDDG